MSSLEQASGEFLEHLRSQGKSARTLYTYGKDLEQIRAYFGADRQLSNILIPHVSAFLGSDELRMKDTKEGRSERAKPTMEKTVRVFRMLMLWAKGKGYIDRLPFTKELEE